MNQMKFGLLLLCFATIALAADGYVQTGTQGIMHFVQVDKDKAADMATYRKAIDELCVPNQRCQVLFWTEDAPVKLPFSREQTHGKTAYWQYNERSGKQHFYVDCDLFGNIEGTECL